MNTASSASRNVVFLFPAHGSEHIGMSKDLYAHFSCYREVFDYCADYLLDYLDVDLRHLIAPPHGQEEQLREKIKETYVVQPALFTVEYSLARFLIDLGIYPGSMLGYSVGEFTAACLADVFSLEDGLKLVAERGRLIQSLPAGSMLAVGLSEEDCLALENDSVSLAAVLEDNHCVLSGIPGAIAELNAQLGTQQVATKELPVSHAFHSVMMDPVVDPFKQLISEVSLSPPEIPFISCVSGNEIDEKVLTANYWANHLRHTIRWRDAITLLAQDPLNLFLEVGPGNLMASLLRGNPAVKNTQRVFSICNPKTSNQSGVQNALKVLGMLSTEGVAVSWDALGNSDTNNLKPARNSAVQGGALPRETQEDTEEDELLLLLEEMVRKFFAETLKLPSVEPHDNFLDCGGNSLMAMQLVARLRDTFNVSIPLQKFFDASTPRGIEHLVLEALQDQDSGDVRLDEISPGSGIDSKEVSKDENNSPAITPAHKHKHADTATNHLNFSLFFFSAAEDELIDAKYNLVLEAARYADEHGFHAIWTPERHFNKFGGLYASPSVLGAALAAITRRIGIRAGSVIAPLGHPFRIAEEWSIVDNLSNGRVGVAFGSGFQPRDFIFAPDHFEQRKKIMLDSIETIQQLWQGKGYRGETPGGQSAEVTMWPRPVQTTLPFWLATTRDPETFEQAGKMGAGVLTAMLRLTLPELQERIAVYRNARAAAGLDPDNGEVTLMLHTFLGPDMEYVRHHVTPPFREYLRSHMQHTQNVSAGQIRAEDEDTLTHEDEEALLDYAFERYFNDASLFGTPESCLLRIKQLVKIGVTEIGCLVDFGIAPEATMESIKRINTLKQLADQKITG